MLICLLEVVGRSEVVFVSSERHVINLSFLAIPRTIFRIVFIQPEAYTLTFRRNEFGFSQFLNKPSIYSMSLPENKIKHTNRRKQQICSKRFQCVESCFLLEDLFFQQICLFPFSYFHFSSFFPSSIIVLSFSFYLFCIFYCTCVSVVKGSCTM